MGNHFCHADAIPFLQSGVISQNDKNFCPPDGLVKLSLLFGILLFLLLPSAGASAQACFGANITRGCAPLTVTIDDKCAALLVPFYNYGDGTVFNPNAPVPDRFRTTAKTHTYTRPGIYTVTQYGTKISEPTGDSLQKPRYIEVLAIPPPAFTANTCSGRTVRVQITDNVYESYLIDFGNGVTQTVGRNAVASQTYPDVTERTIRVTGQYTVVRSDPGPALCGAGASVSVTPVAALPRPQILALRVQNATSAQLIFQAEGGFSYRIEQRNAAGGFGPVATFENTTAGPVTQVIGNLATASQPYTFRVTAFDACGNTLSSEEISTIVLGVTAADSRNELRWQVNATSALNRFDVFSNNALRVTSEAGQTNYTDNEVRCPEQYCYRIEASFAGGAVSASDLVCVNATSTRQPPALQNLTVTVTDGLPVLTWTAPNTGRNEYFITRSANGGAFQPVGRITETTFTDRNARPDAAGYCYQVTYQDACNNLSASSAEICPVRLTVQTSETGNGLSWSPYRTWPGGINGYTVEKRTAAGQLLGTRNAGTATGTVDGLDTVNQVVLYRILVTGNGLVGYSNEVEVRRPIRIFLPQAFTPNGDRTNDRLVVKGLFISRLRMIIYDRWGKAVFASDNRDTGWDGTINGVPAPAGTYVCLISATDQTGGQTTHRFGVLLIR